MKHWRKPLGQDGIKRARYQIRVLDERCKGCRFCIEFCPKHTLQESVEFNSKGYHSVHAADNNDCVDCGLCELICPEFAICVDPVEEEEADDRTEALNR